MEVNESLQLLGLTPNEITIYRYLLRKGISTGTQIYKENSLDKSSTYRALYELMDKDLAYSIGEKRNQRFAARPTEKLVELHKNKLKKLESVSTSINEFVQEINDYAKESYKNNRVQIYEGEEGYKLFMDQRLVGSVDTIYQLGPLEQRVSILKDYYDFMDKHIKRRIELKIPIKVLFDLSVKTDKLDRTNPKIYKEARQIQRRMDLKASLVLFGDRTALYTEQDGQFLGLILKDPLIRHLLGQMFEYLWSEAIEIF